MSCYPIHIECSIYVLLHDCIQSVVFVYYSGSCKLEIPRMLLILVLFGVPTTLSSFQSHNLVSRQLELPIVIFAPLSLAHNFFPRFEPFYVPSATVAGLESSSSLGSKL